MVAKKSYSVFCSSDFRDAVEALAQAKKCTVGDLARSSLLLAPGNLLTGIPDPGEPAATDREFITVQSGEAEGRQLKRKPRLQVRLSVRCDVATIRRALKLALDLDSGELNLAVFEANKPDPFEQLKAANENSQRWKHIVTAISFQPVPGGVMNREQALYVLGFDPEAEPSARLIKEKFKMLAMIYHPDSPWAGDTQRMSQLNQALSILQ